MKARTVLVTLALCFVGAAVSFGADDVFMGLVILLIEKHTVGLIGGDFSALRMPFATGDEQPVRHILFAPA